MSNYYDKVFDSEAYSIEQATLAEDVRFSDLKPLEGKFYLKILTPMVKSGEVSVTSKAALTSANYVTLTIPPYLLIQFMNVEVKTIKVPTKVNPDSGIPTAFNTYNVLCCTQSTTTEATETKASAKVKDTKTKAATGKYLIPKGTIFFAEFLGGQADADKAFIIGISPYKFVEPEQK